ncbi:MAG: DNA-binding transcriptional regulator [Acidimicrobiia bacterium]|nr:MAG: DNA-binding transcriptional regulator [Acidimicrobiia bacterium]
MHDTAGRLLRLLSLLQSRPTWAGHELAARLGVTLRTVRRDVDRLRRIGYPVEATPGPDGGYRLGPGGALPPLLLDDDEAVAVAVGLRAATSGSVIGIEDAAVAALRKLEQVLPARLRPRVVALSSVTVSLAGRAGDAVDGDVLVTIAQACQGSERLRFAYRDRAERASERTVEPYRLVSTGRRWYLVARDVRRAAWRTFRVDRMRAVTATGHRFVLDDPPDAAALVAEGLSIAPYRHRARLLLRAPAGDVASRVPPTVAMVEAVDERSCVLETGADQLDWILAHVLMLGVDFEVLEPAALQERARVLAARLAGAVGTPAGPAPSPAAAARARAARSAG